MGWDKDGRFRNAEGGEGVSLRKRECSKSRIFRLWVSKITGVRPKTVF